jgi:hypothetical protein
MSKDNDLFKGNLFDTAQQMTKMPEVSFTKNGYQIRTDILTMAKDIATAEFQHRYLGWELSAKRDEKTGQIVTTVGMPEFPGIDKIIETAEKMYNFVNSVHKK